jgi:uncharacterized damage-inducible protein DinB
MRQKYEHMNEASPLAILQVGWPTFLGHLSAAIAPLTPDQLDLRVAPHLRSLRQLGVHIITARAWWLHWVMHEGPPELAPMVDWNDEGQPRWTADQIIDGMQRTWATIADGLARWTPEDLAQTFQHPRSGPEKGYSRQWIIWHIAEHDIYHGGEISFSLGIHGLPALEL